MLLVNNESILVNLVLVDCAKTCACNDFTFYKCSSEDQRCDFVLHEWCTRLPAELPNHPNHPQHTLVFVSKVPDNLFGIFRCRNCELHCNGFAYGCTECDYYIDVNCGFIPEEITHEAHPYHILSRCYRESMRKPCVAECWYFGSKFSFSCGSCDFYLHSGCALFLPGIINHKLDKHPMKLTYVNFEAAIDRNDRSLYEYLNIMFGGTDNIKGHKHSVSLAIGSDTDGKCPICHRDMRDDIIVKCLKCKLHAMHWECCKRL
ncbi:zinc finger, PHD-type containing protein [Tanacetum coccineum]